jgi:hypothetical protein
VFNQEQTINTFGPFGHMLAVDAFASQMCSPYATPATVAANLKQYGPAYRQCYAWYGPHQPGVNETDPSNPGGCVPDPGGAPPGRQGPQTSATACPPGALTLTPPSSTPAKVPAKAGGSKAGAGPGANPSPATPGASTPGVPSPGGSPNLQGALGQVTSGIGNATGSTTPTTPTVPATPGVPAPATSSSSSSGTPSAQQAQQLLGYLLSP